MESNVKEVRFRSLKNTLIFDGNIKVNKKISSYIEVYENEIRERNTSAISSLNINQNSNALQGNSKRFDYKNLQRATPKCH